MAKAKKKKAKTPKNKGDREMLKLVAKELGELAENSSMETAILLVKLKKKITSHLSGKKALVGTTQRVGSKVKKLPVIRKVTESLGGRDFAFDE